MSHLFRRKIHILNALPWLCSACFAIFTLMFGVHAGPAAEQLDQSLVFNKCWEYPTIPNLRVNPVSDDANVYLLDNENKLIGIHLLGGTKLWSTELGGEVVSNLSIVGDSIFVVTSVRESAGVGAKTVLWSLSRQTGITEWRTEVPPSPSVSLGRSAGSILALGSDGIVLAVSSKGDVIWKTEIGAHLSSEPYFDDLGAAVGTTKNEVISIAGVDGRVEVLWKSQHPPTAVYFNSRTRLLVGDGRGNLFSLPPGSNPSWRFRNGARISRVSANKFGYVAISDDNFVYNLSRSGDVKWKRRLPGRVSGDPLVLGNAMVVSIVGAGTIYVLDLKNGKVANRIETVDETSAGLAGRPGDQGFVMTGIDKLTYFGRPKCSVK